MGGRAAATCASSVLVALLAALLTASAVAPPLQAEAVSQTADQQTSVQAWRTPTGEEAGLEVAGSQLEPVAVSAVGSAPGDEDLVFGDDVQPARSRPRPGGHRRRRKRPRRPLLDAPAADASAPAAAPAPFPPRPAYDEPEAETAAPRPRRRKLRRRPPPPGADEDTPARYHSRYRDDDLPAPAPRRRTRLRRPALLTGAEDVEAGLPPYNEDSAPLLARRRRPVHQFHARIPEDEPVPLERVPLRGHGDSIPLLEAGNPPLPHEDVGDDDAFLPKPRRRNRVRYQDSQPLYGHTLITQEDTFSDGYPYGDTDQTKTRRRQNLSAPVHFHDDTLQVHTTDNRGSNADEVSPPTGTARYEAGIASDTQQQNEGQVHNEEVRLTPQVNSEGRTAVFSTESKDSKNGQSGSLPQVNLATAGELQEAAVIKQVAVNTAQSLGDRTRSKEVAENKSPEKATIPSVTTAENDGLGITTTGRALPENETAGTPTPVPISLSELLRIKNITLGDVIRESGEPTTVSSVRGKLHHPQQHRRIPIHRLPTPTELFARKRGSIRHTANSISGPPSAVPSVANSTSPTVSIKTFTPHTISVSTPATTEPQASAATKRANDITVESAVKGNIVPSTTVSVKATPTPNASQITSSEIPSSSTSSPSVKLSPAAERVPTSRPLSETVTMRSDDFDEKPVVKTPSVNVPLMMQESPAIDPVKAMGDSGVNGSASSTKSRVVIMPSSVPAAVSDTDGDSEDVPDEDILELLRTQAGSARLAKILQSRNMTLQELIEHRERGSSHQHLSDIFGGKKKPSLPQLPVSLKTQSVAHGEPMQISMADPSRNPRIMTGLHRETSAHWPQASGSGGDSNGITFHPGLRIDHNRDLNQKQSVGTGSFRFPDAPPLPSHPAPPPPFTIFHDPLNPDTPGHIGHVVELELNRQRVLQPVKPNGFFIAEVTEESNDIREQPVTAGSSSHPLQRINSFYDIRPNAINGPELQAVLIHQLTQQSAGKQAESGHKTNWRVHHDEVTPGGAVQPIDTFNTAPDQTVKPDTDIMTADDVDEMAAVREDDSVSRDGAEPDDFTWLSPSARSAVTAGGTVLGAALLIFLAVLVGCRVRQRRRRARARSPVILNRGGCGTLGAKRGLGGTLVLPGHKRKKQEGGQRQYLEDDFAEPPRRYYLWRTIRKTLQYK